MAIADDIIIFGFRDDGKDHDVTVRQVLDKAKAVGMRFNPSKCQFRKTSVKFLALYCHEMECHQTLLRSKH